MLLGAEAKRQDFRQSPGLIPIRIHHIDQKIIAAEFPHHLAADAAGRESAGNDAILAAAERGTAPIGEVRRI